MKIKNIFKKGKKKGKKKKCGGDSKHLFELLVFKKNILY